jgi:hypothetical protein
VPSFVTEIKSVAAICDSAKNLLGQLKLSYGDCQNYWKHGELVGVLDCGGRVIERYSDVGEQFADEVRTSEKRRCMYLRNNLRGSSRFRWQRVCGSLVMLVFVSMVASGQSTNTVTSNASPSGAAYTAISGSMGDSAISAAPSKTLPSGTRPSAHSKRPDALSRTKSSAGPSVPLGIFGASLPKRGGLVGTFAVGDNMNGGAMVGADSVTAAYAVQNIDSTFTPAGVGVPHVVRNTPIDLKMLGMKACFTYGFTDKFAMYISSMYIEKRQNVDVFSGMSGADLLGISKTKSAGFGDSSAVGIYRFYDGKVNKVFGNFGVSLPTGSTSVTDLTFNNSDVYANKRAVYSLQLGTGTFDALPGVTYVGVINKWTWGTSYRGEYPMDKNAHGYRWGDYNELDLWGGYWLMQGLNATLRAYGSMQGHIVGYDPQIIGYGPCSNPLWFGGKHVDLFPGINLSGRRFGLPSTTLAVEGDLPVYQDLMGLHLGKQYGVAIGLKYKFK